MVLVLEETKGKFENDRIVCDRVQSDFFSVSVSDGRRCVWDFALHWDDRHDRRI